MGYREIEHTADWTLEVWAGNLAELFSEAARGMYALSGVRLAEGGRSERLVSLRGDDLESLLVTFLTELLFIGEQEKTAFDRFDLDVDGGALEGTLGGAPIAGQSKEIKAVTFYNLHIDHDPHGYRTRVTFDV